jgi:hypothetical protein
MARSGSLDIEKTKALMAALGRMPPKQHRNMKLGKGSEKKRVSPKPKKEKPGR